MAYDAAAELARVRDKFYNRFYKQPDTECWIWTDALNSKGYGTFRFNGSLKVGAHVASWIIHNGEVTKGLIVLHKCDTRHCVNPVHLYLGTYSQNNIDRFARNPTIRGGSINPVSKEDRELINKLRNDQKMPLKDIASIVGRAISTVYTIAKEGI